MFNPDLHLLGLELAANGFAGRELAVGAVARAARQAHVCVPGISVAELLGRHPPWVAAIYAEIAAGLQHLGPFHEDAVDAVTATKKAADKGQFDLFAALGGGAVLDPATRELLTGHSVVFLRVGLSDAVKRVGLGSARPLLLGNVRGRIKTLLDERTPIYESVATLVVDTDGRTADDVAAEIVEALA